MVQRSAKLGGDHVLGEVARRIGGRAVDLGGVLARESAAAMRRRTAIGVDDDLAAGQAGVAIGAADHEFSGRVDVPVAVAAIFRFAERLADERLDDLADLLGIPAAVEMLRRQHDLRDFRSLAVDVANRDLALGVRTELADVALASMTASRQQLQDLVAVVDRRRHQVGRLATGIAEHDALIARALFPLPVGGVVDALAQCPPTAVQSTSILAVFQ